MTSIVALIAATSRTLPRSSRPVATESFAGSPLVASAIAVAEATGADEIKIVSATPLLADAAFAWIEREPGEDAWAELAELAGTLAPRGIAVWLWADRPLLTATIVEQVVAAARQDGAACTAPSAGVLAIDLARAGSGGIDGGATRLAFDDDEVAPVADKATLVRLERIVYERRALSLLAGGVLVRDPSSLVIKGEVRFDDDVEIGPGVELAGTVVLGRGVKIVSHAIVRDAVVGAGTEIRPFSIVEGSTIGERCVIGPYARVRPDTRVGDESQIGSFVEITRSTVGARAKMNHLSFVGDTRVGSDVIIGAGTITCNHDGEGHASTTIGDHAYIGSGTMLIAPVDVGASATIGAGSAISADVPAGKLTIGRSRQVVVESWKGRARKR